MKAIHRGGNQRGQTTQTHRLEAKCHVVGAQDRRDQVSSEPSISRRLILHLPLVVPVGSESTLSSRGLWSATKKEQQTATLLYSLSGLAEHRGFSLTCARFTAGRIVQRNWHRCQLAYSLADRLDQCFWPDMRSPPWSQGWMTKAYEIRRSGPG